MLVLTRKINQQIRLGDDITITVLRVKGNSIRIGVDAPRSCRVLRGELEPQQKAAQEAQPEMVEVDLQDLLDESSAENDRQEAATSAPVVYQLRTSAPLSPFVRSTHTGAATSLSLQ